MIRVLLAEDHETVREGLRLLVDAQQDMRVVCELSDGSGVVQQANALKVDVVVLDLTMPNVSGLAVAKALRDAPHPPAVVALTRHDDPAYVDALRDAGASGYVLKQSRSTELLRAIRSAASGGKYFDPALAEAETPRDLRRRAATPRITDREQEVLRMMASGYSNKDIGTRLDISIKTVEVHKANAMRKLGLQGRTDVVRYAVLNGWLRDP